MGASLPLFAVVEGSAVDADDVGVHFKSPFS
jgi:hypothetical protein